MESLTTHVSLATTSHQCPVCFKSYKRREHLQRHRKSHSVDRPHRCPACPSSFHRADVLRRHLRTCERIVSDNCSGATRRRACDRCVRQKKACNNARPCQTCLQKGVECAYSTSKHDTQLIEDVSTASVTLDERMEILVTPSVDLWTPCIDDKNSTGFDTLACADLDILQCPDETWQNLFNVSGDGNAVTSAERPYFFHFLDTFTSRTGFVSSFECGNPKQRAEVLYSIEEKERLSDYLSANIIHQVGNQECDNSYRISSQWLNDSLALQTHQILLLLKEVVTIKPRNSSVTISWSHDIEQRCLRFFSPSNLRKYIELYWSIWSPNVNFLHRPSFSAANSKSILLASMAIIGRDLHYRSKYDIC